MLKERPAKTVSELGWEESHPPSQAIGFDEDVCEVAVFDGPVDVFEVVELDGAVDVFEVVSTVVDDEGDV